MKKCYRCDRPIDDNKGYYTADNYEGDNLVCLCSKSCLKKHMALILQIDITKNIKERNNL
ncbi:unnamed protein product [marine sediment metagenome]|uniref:Uncharacterized protein n=1 Tax=marine sediment metagenome TaxID=412755 RepID=X1S8J6_9ZZZZ